jgi:AcrR family transcriptional regulator
MKDLSCISGCSRKEPTQRRGEDRVSALLAAAVAEFAAKGYESATMSSIARRAKSPIGSLYQFFPNKEAVARAVRTRQIMDAEEIWVCLGKRAVVGNVEAFVKEFVARMIDFIGEHPAFLPLLDAPSSTLPVGPRNRLRKQMEVVLKVLRPRMTDADAEGVAEVVLNINKSMMGLYARAATSEHKRIAVEYRTVLSAYLGQRLAEAEVASPATVAQRIRRVKKVAAKSAHVPGVSERSGLQKA